MDKSKDEDVTFDEILTDKVYRAEFDRRVAKAIEKREAAWDEEKKAEIEKIETQISELKTQISDKDTQIGDLNKQVATGTEELQKSKFDKELDIAMSKTGAKNTTALKALLNLEKIKLEEDKLTGFEEQLEVIKKANEYLFESEKTVIDTGVNKNKEDTSDIEDATVRAIMGLPKKPKEE